MSSVSRTPSAWSKSSPALVRTTREAASAYGSYGSTSMSAALAISSGAYPRELQAHALAQPAAADLERPAEGARDRVEDEDPGRQQADADRVEAVTARHVVARRRGEDADRRGQRGRLEDRADEPVQRRRAAADGHGALGQVKPQPVERRRRARPDRLELGRGGRVA